MSETGGATPSPSSHDIHRVIREEGEEMLDRHRGAVAWSGLAAGLSMGFSFLAMAMLQGHLPEGAEWASLVSGFGYTLGFLIVILGRQQLFTESTLTPVLPVLADFSIGRLGSLLLFWAVVLLANLVGTWLFAWALAAGGAFAPPVEHALQTIAANVIGEPFWPALFKAVLAGWLIALMVWLLPSAGSAKILIIVVLTYVVAIGHLPHSIAGSVEAAYATVTGLHSVRDYVLGFLLPTLLGNTIGGVALTAMLNHAPLATEG